MAYIQGTSGRDELYSRSGSDSLYGYSGEDTLYGNGGRDSLIGGLDDDWLEGGKGADTFVYQIGDGNDTIADYQEEDNIQFLSGTPKFSIKGKNVIITVGAGSNKGTITVKNVAENGKAAKTITYFDAKGYEYTWPVVPRIPGGITLPGAYSKDSFDVTKDLKDSSDIVTIDASAVNHDIEITGNKKSNKIIGGDGNDTIYGGKGNDTIWGGEGDDVYAFTGDAQGKNVIADYEMGDVIKITSGTLSSETTSGKDYILTVKSGDQRTTIIVKNAKNKYVTVEDASGKRFCYPEQWETPPYYAEGTLYLLKGYKGDSFDANQFRGDFAGKVYTINASEVTHDIYITGNKYNNTIIGSGHDDTIDGGNGADYIDGGKGNDILIGSNDNDTFVYQIGDGNDTIADYQEEDKLQFLLGKPKFSIDGNNVIITVGTGSNKGTITVLNAAKNGKLNKTITYLDAKGYEYTWPEIYKVNDARTGVTLLSAYGEDSFDVTKDLKDSSDIVTIDASAVNHDIEITGNKKSNKIIGGDGNDTIYSGKGNDTIWGGEGDDVYAFTGDAQGKNVIADYEMSDLIKITSGRISNVILKGKDYILTVKSGAKSTTITVKNAKDKYVTVEDSNGTKIWLPGPIPDIFDIHDVTYYAGGTLNLLKSYRADEFNVVQFGSDFAGKVYTINASEITHDIYITGNKYGNTIIGSGHDDTIDGGNGADYIDGGKGDDILIGGSGKDTFAFNKKEGNDKILDYEEKDTILLNDGMTVSSKKTVGDNVILTLSDKTKITLVGAADNDSIIPDDDDDDDDDVVFGKNAKSVTLFAGYDNDTFDLVGDSTWSNYASSLISINASAVTHALNITANKKSNYILGTFQNDTINAGAGADTIIGGAGNDVLIGGSGKDIFLYNKGDGNDKIKDYDEKDIISINGVEVKTVTANSDDVIITLADKKKITVESGADKAVSLNINGEDIVIGNNPNGIVYNEGHTAVTLTSGYSSDSFTPSYYSAYENTLSTIDASEVTHDMTIIGNALANKIIGTGKDDTINGGKGHDSLWGGKGDDKLYGDTGSDKLYGGTGSDSLWGGKGNDTLYGGAGEDTFVYTLGDGNDTIVDFEAGEKILVFDAEVRSAKVMSGNLTFKIGSGSNPGSILVVNAADKVIPIYDGTGENIIFTYNAEGKTLVTYFREN